MLRPAAIVAVLLVLLAAACGGGDDGAEAVPVEDCTDVLYEGSGEPDVIVVSDLPLRGIGAETTALMVDAVEHVLRAHRFRAGELDVGFQSCNHAVGDEPFDPSRCEANARAFVAAEDVVGVIGPWNSGCAVLQLPILSTTAAGPLALVSPATTYVGLTRAGPGAEPDHPRALYGDGGRNFVRVVPPDTVQGAGAAYVAKQLGARRVAALHALRGDAYSLVLGRSFVVQARRLGLAATSYEWQPQPDYRPLARRLAAARVDAVYVAGLSQWNAKRLLTDVRRELGDSVPILAPDSLASTVRELGDVAEGMRFVLPGVPADRLPAAGRAFLRAFGRPAYVERGFFGAPEAAQAAEALLAAVARSDGSRRSVVDQLFRAPVSNGILGTFRFDERGDVVPAPFGVYRARDGELVTEGVVRVPAVAP